MAGDYNSAEANIILPSEFGSIGNALQNYTATKERRQQREDALSEKRFEFEQRNQLAQQEKSDRNRLYNLKQIQDATAQKQFETPNHIIDNQIGQELSSINNDALKYLGESPEFVSQFIRDRVGKVAQWSDLAKQHAQQIKEGIAEFNKTVPNTDLNKTYEGTNNLFKDNFFEKNQNGDYYKLKDPALIKQNVNYLEQFNDPNKLATVVNSTEPLYKFFKEVPKEAIHGSEYVNKKGNVVSNKWSGWGTPYTQVVGDENDKPTAQVPYQTAMVTDNGEPIKIATPQLRQAMVGNPAVEASFIKEWQNEIASKGLQNIDSHALDILKENFRHRFAEEQLLPTHQVNLDEKVVVPKEPRITVNVGNQAIENNSGKLLEHFNGAIENNSHEVAVPVRGGDGKITWQNENWGDLGKTPLTEPFKATLQVPKTTNGVTTYHTQTVPFDKYFVSKMGDGGYKVWGAVYDRKEDGSLGNKMVKQEQIPTEEYAKRLFQNTTSVKTRSGVVEDNLKDVKGNSQPSMVTVILDGKEGQIPSDKINAFMKKYPNAKRK